VGSEIQFTHEARGELYSMGSTQWVGGWMLDGAAHYIWPSAHCVPAEGGLASRLSVVAEEMVDWGQVYGWFYSALFSSSQSMLQAVKTTRRPPPQLGSVRRRLRRLEVLVQTALQGAHVLAVGAEVLGSLPLRHLSMCMGHVVGDSILGVGCGGPATAQAEGTLAQGQLQMGTE